MKRSQLDKNLGIFQLFRSHSLYNNEIVTLSSKMMENKGEKNRQQKTTNCNQFTQTKYI